MCTLQRCSSSLVLFVLQGPDLSGLYLDVTCFWWPYSADSVMFSLSIPPVNKVVLPESLCRDIILMRSSRQVEAKHALRVCWCISCFVCRALGAQNVAADGVTHPTQQLSQRVIIIQTCVFFRSPLLCDWYWWDNGNQLVCILSNHISSIPTHSKNSI